MDLTAKDIATIVKACRSADVSEFEYGFLKFKLIPRVEDMPVQQVLFDPSQAIKEELNTEIMDTQQNDINEFDEEDPYAHLIAEDPVKYEKLQQFGELDA